MQTTRTKHAPVGRFSDVSKKKSSGATYTPPGFAKFLATEILKRAVHLDKAGVVRIFDPAVGDGELLIALISEMKSQGFSRIEASGFDTNASAAEGAQCRIQTLHPEVETKIVAADFLVSLTGTLEANGDLFNTLISDQDKPFDLVIANPPYVRTQILGAQQAAALGEEFGLEGRVDLYYAFLLGLGRVLHENSVVGIIVSNRFMTTKAGASVRRELWRKFSIHCIWDFGDTKIFDAAVLPAVLMFGPRKQIDTKTKKTIFTSIYSTQNTDSGRPFNTIFESLIEPGTVQVHGGKFEVRIGKLDFDSDAGSVWRIEDAKSSDWLSTVAKHTHCTFRDVGKVRVGIKTTADNVFIRSDWQQFPEEERPELLKPLITHHIARRFKTVMEGATQVLYPHVVVDGRRMTVDLAAFPKSRRYFEKHRDQLEGRKYVIDAGRKWYEVWVPQDPSAWLQPKVVFRDISEKPTFWMDHAGAIVNGDCYWIRAEHEKNEHMLWLILAVANSTFIEGFYDHKFNNKLYAGRRRFMTQYVEEFPLPDPNLPSSKSLISKVKMVYERLPSDDTSALEREIDGLVWKSFGLAFKEVSG